MKAMKTTGQCRRWSSFFRGYPWFCIGLVVILPRMSQAGVQEKVQDWFVDMNQSTSTKWGIYEGQSARYATIGGFSARSPIMPLQFFDIQTPKFSAGCGGIDFYSGGFSAIDADRFIQNLRAIATNAKSLAFMLAIRIVSPQLSGIMENIETWSHKYLDMNLNSCQVATSLVGGSLELMGRKGANCTVDRMNRTGEDWRTANDACTSGGQMKVTEAATGDPNKTDFVKGNLAWYVLMQDPFFRSDTEMAQVVMNLTGTRIIADADGASDGPSKVRVLEPAIRGAAAKDRFDNIYKALLYGKSATHSLSIYRCADGGVAEKTACQEITAMPQTVTTSWDGLHEKVRELIKSIVIKMQGDSALSAVEASFLGTARVPLYRYLAALASYFPPSTDLTAFTEDYTTFLAQETLLKALMGMVAIAQQRSAVLENGISQAKSITEYRGELDQVMQGLAKMRSDNQLSMQQFFTMQERIRNYEQALMHKLGAAVMANVTWSAVSP